MNRNRLLTENDSSRNGLNNSFLNKKNVSSSSFELKFSFLTFSIKFEVMCVLTKIDQFPLLSQIFCYKEWFSGFVWHYNFWYNLCDLLRPIIHNDYECVMISVHNNKETALWWLVVGIILVITCSAREQYLPWSTSSNIHILSKTWGRLYEAARSKI